LCSRRGGATTNYTWDVGAGLPVILQDSAYTYVYGLGLISQTDGAGSQTYMLPDGTKSNETLTDGSGTVSRSYKYDVFGSVRSTSGTGSTDFRYAAEQYDDTVGLIYLRARYYDPATGRFLSKDPAGGKLSSPVTQNKYTYAGNNPVNAGDPTGMVTNAEMNSWMANVPVTYWTPSGGYTSSFSAYSAAFSASRSAPTPVPMPGGGGSCGQPTGASPIVSRPTSTKTSTSSISGPDGLLQAFIFPGDCAKMVLAAAALGAQSVGFLSLIPIIGSSGVGLPVAFAASAELVTASVASGIAAWFVLSAAITICQELLGEKK